MKLRDYGMLSLGSLLTITVGTLIGCLYDYGYENGKSSAMNVFKKVLKEEGYKLEETDKLYSIEKI